MPTKYPDLFRALAEPFAQSEIKSRLGAGGKALSYITPATVMNRLDEVLGPENWWVSYHPDPTGNPHGVVCRMSIRLPDGEIITKEDIGGTSDMKDVSDVPKTGFSDAIKRVASVFGVGRHLRRDGVPDYAEYAEPSTDETSHKESPANRDGNEPVENNKKRAKYADFLADKYKEIGLKDEHALHRAIIQALTEGDYVFKYKGAERKNEIAELYECNDPGWNEWFEGVIDDLRAGLKSTRS